MDRFDEVLAELERVQARLDWLPQGAAAPRRILLERRDALQQEAALLLASGLPEHVTG